MVAIDELSEEDYLPGLEEEKSRNVNNGSALNLSKSQSLVRNKYPKFSDNEVPGLEALLKEDEETNSTNIFGTPLRSSPHKSDFKRNDLSI